jgi:hypothetical protein
MSICASLFGWFGLGGYRSHSAACVQQIFLISERVWIQKCAVLGNFKELWQSPLVKTDIIRETVSTVSNGNEIPNGYLSIVSLMQTPAFPDLSQRIAILNLPASPVATGHCFI